MLLYISLYLNIFKLSMASLAKSIVLTAIGEGRVSVDKIKAFIPRVPMNDLFRLKCEMAVALREARPQDVLMMSENLQASEDDLTFINNMIKCAHNQISMDNAFLALVFFFIVLTALQCIHHFRDLFHHCLPLFAPLLQLIITL